MAQKNLPLRAGDAAPPFALRTSDAKQIRLADVISARAAIVVFIRGTW